MLPEPSFASMFQQYIPEIMIAIFGYIITHYLHGIETAIKELGIGLRMTSKDLATLTVKTETILELHEKRLDTHETILGEIRNTN